MKKIILIIVALLIIGVGAFYGGMKYSQNRVSQNFRNQMAAAGAGLRGNRLGANFISGEIISKDEQSISIKFPDASSKIVFFSDSTEISKTAEGSPGDLEVGKTVMVNGQINQDGSITSQSIQIRPAFTAPPQ